MEVIITNHTNQKINLGGAEIAPTSQTMVDEKFIKKGDIDTISKDNLINVSKMPNGATKYTVSNKTKDNVVEVIHKAYPEDLITSKGDVSKAPVANEAVEAVEAMYDNLLSDNEFKKLYPNTDIKAFRVTVKEATDA